MKTRRIGLIIVTLALLGVAASAQQSSQPRSTETARPSKDARPQIAMTFDDIPVHGPLPPGITRVQVIEEIATALKDGNVPAYGFLNGVGASDAGNKAALQTWVSAGFPIGNHTWSHMNLNQHSLDEFEREITENEPMLKQVMPGGDWHWFRYPFLAEGDTAEKRHTIRTFLGQNGYRVAAVTMSFGDYMFNEPYARCAEKHDAAAVELLENSYLKAADEAIRYSRAEANALDGHDIPYVLLMHVGAFDAKMLPRLIELYKSQGFEFVTLPKAESDEFYRYATDLNGEDGPDSLERALAAKHKGLLDHAASTVQLDSICK